MSSTARLGQQSFNPIDFGFRWVGDWYEFDSEAAHKAALKARNAEAKRLRALGLRVTVYAHAGSLITRGGIGSGHPQIENIVTVYRLDARGES